MTAKPDKFPDWARIPRVDPIVGGSNVVEPPEQKKDDGWEEGEFPPGNFQNWLHKLTNEWLKHFNASHGYFGLRGGRCERISATGVKTYEIAANGEKGLANIYIPEGSFVTKGIDADWADGSGNGGFPSGLTLTDDTWYHFFDIVKLDGTVDAGFDSALNAVNLLADAASEDYVDYKRVWSVYYDSDIRDAIMFVFPGGQRTTLWKDASQDISYIGATLPGGVQSPTMLVPPDINVNIKLSVIIDQGTGTGGIFALWVWSPLTNRPLELNIDAAVDSLGDTILTQELEIITDTSSQIKYEKSTVTDLANTIIVSTIGWEE